MTTATIGDRRKLARDLRPGDHVHVANLGTLNIEGVTFRRGRVVVEVASGTRLTLHETDAVTPC